MVELPVEYIKPGRTTRTGKLLFALLTNYISSLAPVDNLPLSGRNTVVSGAPTMICVDATIKSYHITDMILFSAVNHHSAFIYAFDTIRRFGSIAANF